MHYMGKIDNNICKKLRIKMKNKSCIFAFLAAAVTIFIFYNSSRNAAESSASSAIFSDFVTKFVPFASNDTIVVIVRKCAHVTEFFLQSFMIGWAYFFGKSKFSDKIVNVLFWGLMTACTDEFIQHFSEGRADLVTDVWIDFIGTVCAAAAVLFLTKFVKSKGEEK